MCRHSYSHVLNSGYTHREIYAIGGSADPTINHQDNIYIASTNPFAKEVNKRLQRSLLEWDMLVEVMHVFHGDF
jgi:hypothetical protein